MKQVLLASAAALALGLAVPGTSVQAAPGAIGATTLKTEAHQAANVQEARWWRHHHHRHFWYWRCWRC